MSEVSPSSNAWKNARAWLVIAGVQVVGALVLAFLARSGLISAEIAIRGGMVLIGLSLAAIGNRMPKNPDAAPPPTLKLAVLRQSVFRTAGWAMMLGGLAFAALWTFAPLNVAAMGAAIALGASLVVALGGVTWWIFAYHRSPERWR